MGRKTIDVEGGEELRDVQARAEKTDPILYRQLTGQRLQPLALLPFPDQDETGVGRGRS